MQTIGHIPDTLSKVVQGLTLEWNILQEKAKIYRKHGGAA